MSIGIFKMCHKPSLKSAWLFTIGWRAFFICGKIKRTKEEMLLPQSCRKSPPDPIAEIACAISAGVPQRKNALVWPERTDMTDVIEIHHTI